MNYLIGFLGSAVLALILTPVVKAWALRYWLVARPKEDRWHKDITALYGGVAIFLAISVPYLILGNKDAIFWPLMLGGFFSFCLGLIDDRFHITPYAKVMAQIAIACLMLHFGIQVKAIQHPWIGIPVTIFWFVGMMNAFNLLDNMDGLCAGTSVIAAGIIFAYYGFNGDPNIAILTTLVGGAALGFLVYNFHPARIFMGNCGSMFLGFLLAAAALIGTWKDVSNLVITLACPVLVLGVPLFDTILVSLTRPASGRPIYQGGKDHTSHRLVVLGMSEPRAVLTLYGVSLAFGVLVLLHTILDLAVSIILIASCAILLLFFGIFLSEVKVYSEGPRPKFKKVPNDKAILLSGMIYHKRRIAEVLVDLCIICISYISAYLLRYEGVIPKSCYLLIWNSLPIIIVIKLSTFSIFGLYRGVWKYVGLYDLVSISKAVSLGSAFSVLSLVLLYRFQGYSRTVFVIDWLILLVMISGVRIILRMFREFFASLSKGKRRVLIIGAGDAGELCLRNLKRNKSLNLDPVGFLDDDSAKLNKKIHGVPILGTRYDIQRMSGHNGIAQIIVAIPSLSEESLLEILDICEKAGISCKRMSEVMPR